MGSAGCELGEFGPGVKGSGEGWLVGGAVSLAGDDGTLLIVAGVASSSTGGPHTYTADNFDLQGTVAAVSLWWCGQSPKVARPRGRSTPT